MDLGSRVFRTLHLWPMMKHSGQAGFLSLRLQQSFQGRRARGACLQNKCFWHKAIPLTVRVGEITRYFHPRLSPYTLILSRVCTALSPSLELKTSTCYQRAATAWTAWFIGLALFLHLGVSREPTRFAAVMMCLPCIIMESSS